jgi:hypothetical protein
MPALLVKIAAEADVANEHSEIEQIRANRAIMP